MKRLPFHSTSKAGWPTSGFTLLEVMIAFSIITIVITTLWGLHSTTIYLNLNSQFDTQAPFLAEIRMAQIAAEITDHQDVEQGDFGEEFPGYTWQSRVHKVESESLGTLAEKFRKIEVSVDFHEGEFQYSVTAYRLMPD